MRVGWLVAKKADSMVALKAVSSVVQKDVALAARTAVP